MNAFKWLAGLYIGTFAVIGALGLLERRNIPDGAKWVIETSRGKFYVQDFTVQKDDLAALGICFDEDKKLVCVSGDVVVRGLDELQPGTVSPSAVAK